MISKNPVPLDILRKFLTVCVIILLSSIQMSKCCTKCSYAYGAC